LLRTRVGYSLLNCPLLPISVGSNAREPLKRKRSGILEKQSAYTQTFEDKLKGKKLIEVEL
jgi:hypothetical protein